MRQTPQTDGALLENAGGPWGFARAPLFVPALAFAAGCYWGSGEAALFWPAAATVALMAALWSRSSRKEAALLSFLGALFFLGVGSASLHKGWTPGDDLRRLPPSRLGADGQWEGTIGSVPLEKERRGTHETIALFVIDRGLFAQHWRPASGRVLLEVSSAPVGGLVLSQRLRVRGALRRPAEPRNPGYPDWQEILAARRIAYRMRTPWHAIQPLDGGNWLGRCIGAARQWASRLLQTGIERDRQAVALLTGMLYGQTGGLAATAEEEFRRAGAYHIFAVSGQNIAAVLAVGLALFEAARISRWRWGWLLLPVVLFYALLSGGSGSVGRAALLACLVLTAWLLRRPLSLLNLWAASLLLLLAPDPLSVRDVSLQLSFGVVLALLLLGSPLSRALAAPFAADPFIPRSLLPRSARLLETCGTGLAYLLGSSFAASLGALPFEILHFHFVSLAGPFANLLVVPLAELIVSIGILSLSLGSLWSFLGVLLNNANWLFAHALLATVSLASHLPGAGIAVGDPSTLLSGASGLRLLFPAVPLGSVCLIRREGKLLLVQPKDDRGSLVTIEPIRRFYGWNWLDAEIRLSGERWLAGRRAAWGTPVPLAPFDSLSPTSTLLLQPLPARMGNFPPRAALLIRGKHLPLLALSLALPTDGEGREEKMDLLVSPEGRPHTSLHLALRTKGAWLEEGGWRKGTGRVQDLGRSALEVVLEPGRIDFRPYRRPPVSYAVGLTSEEDGAASQIPSSPDGTVQ